MNKEQLIEQVMIELLDFQAAMHNITGDADFEKVFKVCITANLAGIRSGLVIMGVKGKEANEIIKDAQLRFNSALKLGDAEMEKFVMELSAKRINRDE